MQFTLKALETINNSLWIKLLFAAMAVVVLPFSNSAQQRKATSKRNGNYIESLLAVKDLSSVYADDGAGDGTLMENPILEIKRIVGLRAAAIPLLIEHLDDERLTTARFSGGFNTKNPTRVTLGFVCLDILMGIVEHTPKIFVRDCADDGMGACVNDGYYFRPDDYTLAGKRYNARTIVHIVKRHWQRAYARGQLRFHYPDWWN
ncbi:MAG TPA: hypothetical protein VFC63_06210 [Blastocatellia bacterium]|nr:hypothetical protein [Blastocatellia bacterium]